MKEEALVMTIKNRVARPNSSGWPLKNFKC